MQLPQRRRLQTIIMIVSLFFSFFSMQRQVPEVPSCAASTVTRKLHRFLRLHLNLFRGRGRGFCDEEQTAAPHHQSIFSSIPSIPRNNERNRRRFRRRVTSPFVLYSYQTVYCVSTIYTRRKLRFILYNWRGKKWRKMLLTTQKEAFRRDTNHRTRRRMESTSSSVARVRRPVVCARARVRCLKCCRTKEHVGCARGRTDAPTRKFLSKIQCSFEHHFHGRHA